MAFLEKIYEQYITGAFDIKPENITSDIYTELEKSRVYPTEKFVELISDIAARYGKEMFFAGFRLAFEFINELSAE